MVVAHREFDSKDLALVIEQAQATLAHIMQDIDLNTGEIKKSHDFEEKIAILDNIFLHLHLETRQHKELHRFLETLFISFQRLLILLQSEKKHKLHFLKEESRLLDMLKRDVKNHRWKAAWHVAEDVSDKKIVGMSVDLGMLKKILSVFHDMQYDIDTNEHVVIEIERKCRLKKKDEEALALDGLLKIIHALYNFIDFYRDVFQHMLLKEQLKLIR